MTVVREACRNILPHPRHIWGRRPVLTPTGFDMTAPYFHDCPGVYVGVRPTYPAKVRP